MPNKKRKVNKRNTGRRGNRPLSEAGIAEIVRVLESSATQEDAAKTLGYGSVRSLMVTVYRLGIRSRLARLPPKSLNNSARRPMSPERKRLVASTVALSATTTEAAVALGYKNRASLYALIGFNRDLAALVQQARKKVVRTLPPDWDEGVDVV